MDSYDSGPRGLHVKIVGFFCTQLTRAFIMPVIIEMSTIVGILNFNKQDKFILASVE